jgi:murein DD-endopeptidase MepM/ murein hydrolase activator NlpD
MQTRDLQILAGVGVALIAIVFYVIVSAYTNVDQKDNKPFQLTLETVSEITPLPAKDRYGYEKGVYEYEEHKVKRNESLYIILRRYDISPQQIYKIQQESSDIANLSRIVPGQRYRIYFKDNKAVSFVWHPEITRFVTVDWADDYKISNGSIPVRFVTKEASGIIRSSLYESIVGKGHSPYLGAELAAVFAWQVDFFALREGDHFKVIYEERYAGDQFVGLGDVKAAEFQHRGETHRAFFFDHDERRGYFDNEGNSLEKELLKAPFRYNQRISSSFSRNRFHPILRENRPHYGTDYAAPTGTPILSVGEGIVTEARRRGGNGNIVQIRHNGSYRTAYLHLNGFAPGIKKGVQVEQGQIIGYVGETGLATGPHLCYRMYVNNRPINSVAADLPASDSLDETLMPELQRVINRFRGLLDELQLVEKVAVLEESAGKSQLAL